MSIACECPSGGLGLPIRADGQAGCAGKKAQNDVRVPDADVVTCVSQTETTAPGAAEGSYLMQEIGEAEQGRQAACPEQAAYEVGSWGNCSDTGEPQAENDCKERPVGQGKEQLGHP